MPPKRIKTDLSSQKTLFSFMKAANVDESSNKNRSGPNDESREQPSTADDNATVVSGKLDVENESQTPDAKSGDHRKYHKSWEKNWTWLSFTEGKMFCKLCVENGRNNAYTTGCTNLKTCGLKRHEDSKDHMDCLQAKPLKRDLETVMGKVHSTEDEAMIKASKVVYWLVSENVALSKYESLMSLLKELGVPKLDVLKINERVNYESYYSANEILSAISEQIDNEITDRITQSPYITVLADESTDITNSKRMTMHARIVDPKTSVPSTVYLRDVEYEDGTGEGLTQEILNEFQRRNIPPDKVIGFGSDGATVMTGDGKGVKGRLKERNPHMIHVHCMAHRLALCTSQAAEGIATLKKYQDWLTQLFYYLKLSATREKELHKVQEVLNHPRLKYKEIHAVRWLSCYEAVEAVYRTLDPLLTYFHQRNHSKDPKAKGLLKLLASRQFIYITYLMMDILPIVSKLCLTFQSRDLDVAKAKVSLDQCIDDLESYRAGKQLFPTHIQQFEDDVKETDGHYEFKGHILSSTDLNLSSLKSQLLNKLITNINKRFPQKSLMNSFFVLAMRSINLESNPEDYGNEEIDVILNHFEEEQIHKDCASPPLFHKDEVKIEWRRAKMIVRSLNYPVDRMKELWQLLTTHHRDELPNLIRLAQIALCLPLHTADCERTFSVQNQILTKLRNRLQPSISDKLLRVRIHGKGLEDHNFSTTIDLWHRRKRRLLGMKRSRVVLDEPP